jgi:hypothetical protein
MRKLATIIFLSAVIIGGCASGKDFTYEPAQETPPGAGLFSGEDGVFTLYGEETPPAPENRPMTNQDDKAEQSL